MRHELPRPRQRFRIAALCAVLACTADRTTVTPSPDASATTASAESPGVHRQYGPPITLGDGKVRAYVVLDAKEVQHPLEIGVAIDARAMEGALPADMIMRPIALPARAPDPYRFVLFDWNPMGHPPAGIFDVPHFDFHFYIVPQDEVDAIVPSDPGYAAKANNLPTGELVPPLYAVARPPGTTPAAVATPRMGVHWQDLLSPEYQRVLGRPDLWQPFTKTYTYVSWDGGMTALEPMITREYLLRRISEIVPVRQPARYPSPGWYPGAYQIEYDDHSAEYRVALVGFAWRE